MHILHPTTPVWSVSDARYACALTPTMPAYHSSYNDEPNVRQVAGMSILPLHARTRGPAPMPGTCLDVLTR